MPLIFIVHCIIAVVIGVFLFTLVTQDATIITLANHVFTAIIKAVTAGIITITSHGIMEEVSETVLPVAI